MFIFMLILSAEQVFAVSTDPPVPGTTENKAVPCSQEIEDGGTGTPPPPGLCLPINNYLMPLLISGLCLGTYFVMKSEAKGTDL